MAGQAGIASRKVFFPGDRKFTDELIVEMAMGQHQDIRTYVAYGLTALRLRDFIDEGLRYWIEYDPTPGSTYDGELRSARLIQG
jgi:hypothetical protein